MEPTTQFDPPPTPTMTDRPLVTLSAVPTESAAGSSPFAPWEPVWRSSLGWEPSPEQAQAFQRLYQAVLVGNRQLNLTRITEPAAFWEKHLWDSLRGIVHFLRPVPDVQTEVAGPP